MTFPYEPASWDTQVGRCQPGAVALADYAHECGFGDVGCFNDRPIAGTSTPSVHREGRAVDLTPGDDAMSFWRFLYALVDTCERLQTQQVIFDGRFWRVGLDGFELLRADADQHLSHAHVELTKEAAAYNTLASYHAVLDPILFPDDPSEEDDDMPAPTLYRDVAYANVFAIFPTGEVVHCSSALVEHYQAAGAGDVVVADPSNVQTVRSLLAKSGLSGTDALVPFGL